MKKYTLPLLSLFVSLLGLPACYNTKLIQDQSPNKAITAFRFALPNGVVLDSPEVVATIGTDSIWIKVPDTLNRVGLIPIVTITGVVLTPGNNVPQNFTYPVTYTVTAADGTTQPYKVILHN